MALRYRIPLPGPFYYSAQWPVRPVLYGFVPARQSVSGSGARLLS